MGTTPQEITAAVNQCVNEQGGNCQLAFGADSIPQHSVTVSAFQIERTEVTYRQYLVFLNALGAGSHLSGCDGLPCAATRAENENSNILFDGFNYRVAAGALENYPASDITWYGADAYCRAIGRRLPTEAEWERAARGRDNFIYPWGNEWDSSLAKTSIPAGQPGTMPVGSFPSGVSSYGAFDLAGNVAEWVSDWYDPTFYSKPQASGLDPNGPGPGTLNQKVIRGGSWDAKPFFARSVHRQSDAPYYSGAWLGFRCAADFAPPGSTTTPPTRPTSTFTPTLIQPTPTPAPTSAHPTLTVTPT